MFKELKLRTARHREHETVGWRIEDQDEDRDEDQDEDLDEDLGEDVDELAFLIDYFECE